MFVSAASLIKVAQVHYQGGLHWKGGGLHWKLPLASWIPSLNIIIIIIIISIIIIIMYNHWSNKLKAF